MSARRARSAAPSLTPLALLAAAAFAATHVPPAGWANDYGLGGMLGDAVLGALMSALPFELALALALASVGLGAAFVLASAYALGVTWAEVGGFARFLGQGSVLLYSGAHSLTGRAVAGAAGGVRAARGLASDARARRTELPLPRPGLAGAAAAQTAEDNLMAKIGAAVRARAEAEAAARQGARRGVPPLTADHAEIDLLDRDRPDPGPPEPRVQKPSLRPLPKSARARSEEEPELALDAAAETWRTPPLSLLQSPATIVRHHLSTDALEENARMLENVLDDYGVRGEIVSIRPGPVVTMYELEPAAGLKASRVIGLADDIARSMSALACRVSTIPGRSVIGIELPNELRERVLLREILAAKAWGDSAHALPLGARQGHRRRAGGGEPRADAAPPDRRHHRLGQVGGDQHHDPVAALPARARPVPADHDRPQDAGALGLRRHPAPALPRRHRPQEGGGGAEVGGR